jgi:hypothetical protein
MALPRKRVRATIVTVAATSVLAICLTGCLGPAQAAAPATSDCAAALAYLAAHEAPGFVSYCPHYADGNAAETVVPPQAVNSAGAVHGVIYIANTTCAAAYENEAANSHGHLAPMSNGNYQWVWPVPFDPYGPCPS